jgi:hypothetical protein
MHGTVWGCDTVDDSEKIRLWSDCDVIPLQRVGLGQCHVLGTVASQVVSNAKRHMDRRQVVFLHVALMVVEALLRPTHVKGRWQSAVGYFIAQLLTGLAL